MKKQEIRMGFEWYRKLSKKQRKQFKANCEDFQGYLNESFTFYRFVARAFAWVGTPQGVSYWGSISEKQL